MKRIAIFMIVYMSFNIINVKAQTTDIPSGFTASNAGKYSKCFGKLFMRIDSTYGKFQNYSLSIEKWDVTKLGDGDNYYRVFLTVSWSEVDGFSQQDYKYKGAITFDQFGCNACFWISEKTEPSLFGVGKRTNDLTSAQTEKSKDFFPDGAKWAAMPTGCLCD